jgi:hypothetical protein
MGKKVNEGQVLAISGAFHLLEEKGVDINQYISPTGLKTKKLATDLRAYGFISEEQESILLAPVQ